MPNMFETLKSIFDGMVKIAAGVIRNNITDDPPSETIEFDEIWLARPY